MPIYTYQCDNCGVRFDRHQKFTDPVLTRCPECNKKALRKIFQPVGIVFKGSGFYATDHRSPSGQGHASKSDKPGEGGTSGGSESKPAESKPSSESKPSGESKSD